MEPTLLTHYKETVVPALKEKLGATNPHQVPQIQKVVVTSSVGSQPDRSQALEDVVEEIGRITGQKPITILSKKAVSNFRLRAGEPIAAKVTLRSRQMYEFLDRFMKTAVPSIRDFRGVSRKSFDGNGNYTVGVSDQTIFPEVELDKVKRQIGFDISIVTSAVDDESALELLTEMGMPFRKPPSNAEIAAAEAGAASKAAVDAAAAEAAAQAEAKSEDNAEAAEAAPADAAPTDAS